MNIEELRMIELVSQSADQLHYVWTYMLLVVRYTAFMSAVPGIGMGARGLPVRMPAILLLALATMLGTPAVPLPNDWLLFVSGIVSEVILGFLIAIIPYFIITGVQTAMSLASQTMGLGMASIIDPTMGISVTSMSRIFGDLVTILFLYLGGHYVVVQAVSGMGGTWVPGTFLLGANSISMLISQTAKIFEMGVIISAPVIVALLLTQFVMGLISKAVPSVNIFIVSFPLTIGIGLVLSMLAIPDIFVATSKEFAQMDELLLRLGADMRVQ